MAGLEGETRGDLAKEERNSEQEAQPGGTIRKFLRILFTHILTGPGHKELNDLTCVNVVYLLFLFSFLLTTSSLYIPTIRSRIQQELNNCTVSMERESAPRCTGFVSAESINLRIGFTFTITFFTFSLLAINSRDSLRAKIHQGFWIVKFFFILVLLSTSLFIPISAFDVTWSIIGFAGTLLFQFFQSVVILDLATSASDVFVVKITEERSKLWYLAWLLCAWLIYLTAIVLTVCLYTMLMDRCGLRAVLLTTVVTLCTLATIVALYFSDRRTGLLHSGLSTLFILLLTLSTLERERLCSELRKTDPRVGGIVNVAVKFIDILLGFLIVVYTGVRSYNTRHYHYGKSTISRDVNGTEQAGKEETAELGENLTSPERIADHRFSPSLFFTIFGLFSLFLTSKLTELKKSENDKPVINTITTFYLKSLAILLVIATVIWSQIFPTLFPSEDPFDVFVLIKTLGRFVLRACRRLLIDGCTFCNGPTLSRVIFALLFVFGLIFSCLLYVPVVRHTLGATHYFCPNWSPIAGCLGTDPAYMAVYRICFAMATFYLLFALILVRVDNARDPRVDLQYKAWPVKFCLFFSLLFCSFFLPNEFSRMWIYAALVGTFSFTVLQLALLIYWTKNTTKRLEEKVETSSTRFWSVLLATSTFIVFLVCLGVIITFYVFFTRHSLCLTNTVFISLNLVLAIVASVTSVHPRIYDAGLFQCSIIVVFSLYLTWSGLSHNPEERCNPVAGYIAEVDMRPNLNIQAGMDLLFTVITVAYFSNKVPAITEYLRDMYDMIRHNQLSAGSSSTGQSQASTGELDGLVYNFSLFHLVYFLASLHATMILTNWFIPTQGSRFKLSVNWAAMCVKMTGSSMALIIYVWCIVGQLATT